MKIDNFFCNQNCVPETPDNASKRNEESYWNIPFWKIIHYGCCFKNVSQPKFYKSQAILNHTFKLTKQSEANFFMIGWMILSIKIILWLNIEMFERRNNRKQVFFFTTAQGFFEGNCKVCKIVWTLFLDFLIYDFRWLCTVKQHCTSMLNNFVFGL